MAASPFSLAGKTALVTGGNVGLGQPLPWRWQKPADIVPPAAARRKPRSACWRWGVAGIEADSAAHSPIAGIVEQAIGSSAGSTFWSTMPALSAAPTARRVFEEDWDAVIDTNLKSAFFPGPGGRPSA
ncbi:MAG: hypothetical protein R3C16_11840 [Hyphomonadaceae bacterium]